MNHRTQCLWQDCRAWLRYPGPNTSRNFLAVLSLLITFGCGFPEKPRVISVSRAAAFRSSTSNTITTIEQALAAIVTICREDLGLPGADSISVNLYDDGYSFGLFTGGWLSRPLSVSGTRGITRNNEIHINLQQTGQGLRGQLIWTLAHEYGHTIEAALVGKSRDSWWFGEGFADWVAAKTLHSLGYQDYTLSLHRAQREVRMNEGLARSLAVITGQESWERLGQMRLGRIRTYSVAFLATDKLIQRYGVRAALEFAKTGDFSHSFQDSPISLLLNLVRRSNQD